MKEDLKKIFESLDRYLIGDLNTMIIEIKGRNFGGLGYPAIQTIAGGMELLGKMLSGGHKSKGAFEYFWEEYFAVVNPSYKDKHLMKIFRDAVRDGTAHYFLVKFGIQVSKEGRNNLTKTKENNLNIDLIVLFEDFHKTYNKIKQVLLESDEKSEILKKFYDGYKSLLSDLNDSKVFIREFIKNMPNYKDTTTEVSMGISKSGSSISYTTPANFATVTSQVIHSNASTTTLPTNLINTIPSEAAE